MATSDRSVGDSVDVDAFLRPLRHRWVKWIVLFEALLFVGGYLIASMAAEQTSFTAGPSLETATGAVMGALGVGFGLMFLVLYAGFVAINVRSKTASGRTF